MEPKDGKISLEMLCGKYIVGWEDFSNLFLSRLWVDEY